MTESTAGEAAPFVTRRSLAEQGITGWEPTSAPSVPQEGFVAPAPANFVQAGPAFPASAAPDGFAERPVGQGHAPQGLGPRPSRAPAPHGAPQPVGTYQGAAAGAPAPGAQRYGDPAQSQTPASRRSVASYAPGQAAPQPAERPVAPQPPVHHAPLQQQQQQQQQQVAAAQGAPIGGQPVGAPRRPVDARPAGAGRTGLSRPTQSDDVVLDSVLRIMVDAGASDLHLTAGSAPKIRVNGSLVTVDDQPEIASESLQRTLYAILTQKQREKFEANLELDFSYSVRGLARFRVNFYQQRESIGAAFRLIPYEIKPLEELGVPPVVSSFANLPRGLVLVAGPTGSGKSTTLASIIDLANRTRSDHIMTVEDPIEFLHRHKKSLINQREVGADTHSFANALKHVLRQDPDIILVGEMRDLETISVALTAAETGHLVFATLHTQDAAQTIDRIIDVFPPEQQGQVRTQLGGALQGVVCQTLCKRADGPGRVVATEVMVATPAVRNLIREGKTHQVYSAMQAGKQQGMHTMDQHLADLVRQGRISYETGLEKCHHIEDFNRLSGRSGGSTGAGFAAAGMGGQSYGASGH